MATAPALSDYDYLTDEEKAELAGLLAQDKRLFYHTPGPQFEAATSQADIIGYGGAAGGGKLLPLETPIHTADGLKPMGEIAVGDRLFDKDGLLCTVTALSAIEPKPELWEFEFDDGVTVTSCVDHQWLTFDAKELEALTRRDLEWQARRRTARPSRATGNRSAAFTAAIVERNRLKAEAARLLEMNMPAPTGKTKTTRQILDSLRTPAGRANHAIPLATSLRTPEADLPIDPYVLGAWLGDGTSVSGGFTGIDPEIWQRIEAVGYAMSHAPDGRRHHILGLQPQLRALGVLGDKHIPRAYFRASPGQRLALLQGLMDTDGTVARASGSAEFCNTNPRIVDGVLELICSLGWKARKREGRARLNGRDCGPKWTLKFVASDYVFHLGRKRALQKLATRRTTQFRYIVAARPIESRPGRCLSVDSPSRTYLVGLEHLVTHNTMLISGLALTEHKRSVIFRQHKNQTRKFVQDFAKILGSSDGYSSQNSEWKIPIDPANPAQGHRLIEFGGLEDPNDHEKWQGRDHDLKAYDEATQMREYDVRYTMAWCRSDDPAQRTRVLLTFNPPTTVEGRWVIRFFAPWLDPAYPQERKARDGELRWFTTVGAEQDFEVPDARPFVIEPADPEDPATPDGRRFVYDFDPALYRPEDIYRPTSRTFITARVTDNPYYMATGYISTLQNLPEPLRSQMLRGDFMAGVEDDARQVIPTRWVELAMERHTARTNHPSFQKGPMSSMGVDVARGGNMGATAGHVGRDKLVTARRHGTWFDQLIATPGIDVNTGNLAAAQILAYRKDQAPVHIDVIGVGTSVYDALQENNVHAVPINGQAASEGRDRSNLLKFTNKRAEIHWRMREALDPEGDDPVALPPDPELLSDLTAPRWFYTSRGGIQVESKDDIRKRLGRSPDRGEAVMYANVETPKMTVVIRGYAGLPGSGTNYEDQRLKELDG